MSTQVVIPEPVMAKHGGRVFIEAGTYDFVRTIDAHRTMIRVGGNVAIVMNTVIRG